MSATEDWYIIITISLTFLIVNIYLLISMHFSRSSVDRLIECAQMRSQTDVSTRLTTEVDRTLRQLNSARGNLENLVKDRSHPTSLKSLTDGWNTNPDVKTAVGELLTSVERWEKVAAGASRTLESLSGLADATDRELFTHRMVTERMRSWLHSPALPLVITLVLTAFWIGSLTWILTYRRDERQHSQELAHQLAVERLRYDTSSSAGSSNGASLPRIPLTIRVALSNPPREHEQQALIRQIDDYLCSDDDSSDRWLSLQQFTSTFGAETNASAPGVVSMLTQQHLESVKQFVLDECRQNSTYLGAAGRAAHVHQADPSFWERARQAVSGELTSRQPNASPQSTASHGASGELGPPPGICGAHPFSTLWAAHSADRDH